VKKGDYIFVYGTLRRGERADLSRHETEFGVKYLNTDTINGVIHNLGGFPGLKRDGVEYKFDSTAPQVTGEVFRIKDECIVAILDAYEGYPHMYGRECVETQKGKKVWVYTYNYGVSDDSIISSGDWVKRSRPIIRETVR
jgi:gamma-glutamylcyclotransferase (GGCT)/AIG2-like uncharacterized protein YtfP